MTRPSSVRVAGQTFAVVWPANGSELLYQRTHVGRTLLGEQRITVADGMGPDQERDTLLHEIIHALRGVMAIDSADEAVEERLVAQMTPLLLQVLRDNPDLVEYLRG